MKLYAPSYYPDFTCAADRCRHSCCVGWEIDVDEATACRYAALTEGYGACVRDSVETDAATQTPHFRLGTDERCPHLDERGLCRIILLLGEEYLCDICREHPRFYHTTPHGMEVGLGMACEEACRLILTSDGYDRMIAVGEEEGEAEPAELDATAHRTRIYEMMSDRAVPYTERLTIIADAYGVSLSDRTDAEWRERLASLEYLDEAHRALFGCYSSGAEQAKAFETALARALAYFVFRHVSSAADADELCAAVGFSLLCERLLASLIEAREVRSFEAIVELARTVSEELEYSEDNTETLKQAFWTL